MNNKEKRLLVTGIIFLIIFGVWTILVLTVDVQPAGQNGTDIGFAAINCSFHRMTGVHMTLYTATDWLGLVPVAVCIAFAAFGFVQLVKRKSILKVDWDILISGIYYMVVIAGYLAFEIIPVNYRPVLINGVMEVSYPSSTTLLVLSVMPALMFQIERRSNNDSVKKIVNILVSAFMVFMVTGRLISGVHWLTDIIGSVILCAGLFKIYKAAVLLNDKNRFGD